MVTQESHDGNYVLTLNDWVFLNFILNGSMQCTIIMQNREHIHYLNVPREFIVMQKFF